MKSLADISVCTLTTYSRTYVLAVKVILDTCLVFFDYFSSDCKYSIFIYIFTIDIRKKKHSNK